MHCVAKLLLQWNMLQPEQGLQTSSCLLLLLLCLSETHAHVAVYLCRNKLHAPAVPLCHHVNIKLLYLLCLPVCR
jgi:hypothetical protein